MDVGVHAVCHVNRENVLASCGGGGCGRDRDRGRAGGGVSNCAGKKSKIPGPSEVFSHCRKSKGRKCVDCVCLPPVSLSVSSVCGFLCRHAHSLVGAWVLGGGDTRKKKKRPSTRCMYACHAGSFGRVHGKRIDVCCVRNMKRGVLCVGVFVGGCGWVCGCVKYN